MMNAVRKILAEITTVSDMVAAFRDEERCRRLLLAAGPPLSEVWL
jgi:hypothetical protein